MENQWMDKLRQIDPYVPGEQSKDPDLVKLNANENPYPPSPRVEEILRGFHTERLRFYPDANSGNLRAALAKKFGVAGNMIFMGNGSDDVLALCFQAFFCSDKPILYPDITYSFYPVWCSLFRTPYETVPLTEDFRIDPRSFDRPNGGVIFPNPNAPTGICEGLDFIEDILQHNQDCIVLVDEAYIDFGGTSCLPLLGKYKNLVVVQTMSKSRSLAGLRVGYAIAAPELIATLEAVKNSYNSYTMDMLTLDCATASVEDEAYFQASCQKVIATRARTTAALTALGFTVLPSQANFVFATHQTVPAKEIFEKLKARKIFVRYFRLPRIDNYLRITIGTDEEMDKLLAALRDILPGRSVLVLAPHEDDEILMSAGILRSAVERGDEARVCMLTNGDYESEELAAVRADETCAALARLGVEADHIDFLGYADTGMAKEISFLWRLWEDQSGVTLSSRWGRTETWSPRGDWAMRRRGCHSPYTRAAFFSDLCDVLEDMLPDEIFVTAACDYHGDHAAADLFAREAISKVRENHPGWQPRLYEYPVHTADELAWPNRDGGFFTCPEDIEALGLDWNARERRMQPAGSAAEKRELINSYASQDPGAYENYLLAFAKNEEIFWPVTL